MMRDVVSFIIPAHNEEENIVLVLDELGTLGLGHDVLVVDDASSDRTRSVLAARSQRSAEIVLHANIIESN